MILGESSAGAQRNSESCKNLFEKSAEKSDCETDCMRYGLGFRVFRITTADDYILRYCVPMDNQRPGLDLKFYKDICPDQNGVSLRTFGSLTVFNTSPLEFPSSFYIPNMISSYSMLECVWMITRRNTRQIAMYLKWRRSYFKSTTCIPLGMTSDLCD